MTDIRLADGCPVWVGAAVAPDDGGDRRFVHAIGETGRLFTSPNTEDSDGFWPERVNLDLTHRPTRLELSMRINEAVGGTELTIGGGETIHDVAGLSRSACRIDDGDHEGMKALWRSVDPQGDGPKRRRAAAARVQAWRAKAVAEVAIDSAQEMAQRAAEGVATPGEWVEAAGKQARRMAEASRSMPPEGWPND